MVERLHIQGLELGERKFAVFILICRRHDPLQEGEFSQIGFDGFLVRRRWDVSRLEEARQNECNGYGQGSSHWSALGSG
jgi:hypothetical protein